ncbi:HORMA domain protein, partial [Trichuris suis]
LVHCDVKFTRIVYWIFTSRLEKDFLTKDCYSLSFLQLTMDISLYRSSDIVTIDFINDQSAGNFLYFAINTIVYQRQVYPADVFTRVVRFGLPLMVNTSESFKNFLNRVVDAFQERVASKQIQKISLVICSIPSGAVVERWDFVVSRANYAKLRGNCEKQVQRVFHSISAVACFLKPLPPLCECDVELYIPTGSSVPDDCEVINPMFPKCAKNHNLPTANVGPADFKLHVITEF